MSQPLPRRVALVVLLALTVAPLRLAAYEGPGPGGITVRGWIWTIVTRMVKDGCMIDPHGLWCSPAPVQTKDGCMIDPSGRCLPKPEPAPLWDGCTIDPDGACTAPEGGR